MKKKSLWLGAGDLAIYRQARTSLCVVWRLGGSRVCGKWPAKGWSVRRAAGLWDGTAKMKNAVLRF